MWDLIMQWIQSWYTNNATLGTLLLMMFLDVLSGLILAGHNSAINSSMSGKGMRRKAMELIFVMVGAALERFIGNAPIAESIAIGFCLTEVLSIVENAGKLGMPIPAPLKRVMSVLAEQTKDNSQRPDLLETGIERIEKDGSL